MDVVSVMFIAIGVCFLATHVLIERLEVYYHQIGVLLLSSDGDAMNIAIANAGFHVGRGTKATRLAGHGDGMEMLQCLQDLGRLWTMMTLGSSISPLCPRLQERRLAKSRVASASQTGHVVSPSPLALP